MSPIHPDVNPFTPILLAVAGLVLFGWSAFLPAGAPVPLG
jgi:hypothetical protein